jgi:four helix bundle protein
MATLNRFEELEAWQKARELAQRVYRISDSGRFYKDRALREQIRRAAVSALSNIAEGFERSGTGEFVQFLAMAKGSVAEVEAQLYVALDQTYVSQVEFDALREVTGSTKRLIAGLMKYLRTSGIKGQKYH